MSPLETIRRRLRRYRVQVAARVLGVVAAFGGSGAVLAWGGSAWTLVAALLGLLGLALLFRLVRFVERPLKDLLRFFEGIRYDDLTVHVAGRNRGPLVEAYATGFEEVAGAFRRLRSEREEQAQYLQTVVRHIGVALVAFQSDGTVTLCNPAARRLFGVSAVRHLGQLATSHPALAEVLPRLRPGERTLVRTEQDGQPLDLAVHATQFRLLHEPTTLVSLQDIRSELEERELEAWQQLTRVLTHEIANSVTPIASLAATASARVPDGDGDLREALATIERRSQGLVRFVESYKSLTRIPAPRLERVPASDLFGGVRLLLGTALRDKQIALETVVRPPDLELTVDPEQIEQVLINLLLNAIEAVEGRPAARIRLSASVGEEGRPVLAVADNGPGVEPEARERIFVPFFSTKAGGSGIGLSLSRQILRLHGGTLTVHSEPDVETAFVLRF